MCELFRFFHKSVNVTLKDGEKYSGYVDLYTSAADNDDTEESIGIMPEKNARVGVYLYASEIQTIETAK